MNDAHTEDSNLVISRCKELLESYLAVLDAVARHADSGELVGLLNSVSLPIRSLLDSLPISDSEKQSLQRKLLAGQDALRRANI